MEIATAEAGHLMAEGNRWIYLLDTVVGGIKESGHRWEQMETSQVR
jgi:hypothetical protein